MSAELELIARLKNEAKAGLTGLKGDIKDVGQEVDKADKKTTALSKTMKVGLVAGAAAGAAAIGAVVVGLKKLGDAVVKGIELAGIQQDAEVQLAQTIESTGMAAGLTADELKDMASGLQSVTTFGDETIIRGQALLLTFTSIGEEVFPRATEASLDMAQVFGSVDAAAIQLGKALNDPVVGVTALQRVGVSFTVSQKEQIRVLQESGDLMGAQTIILDELARQFGGQARAAAETYTGAQQQMNNIIGDGYEILGFAFTPALTDLYQRALPLATEGVETMSASLETQLIPLVNESIELLLELGEAGSGFVSAGEDAITFEDAVRRTRNVVILARIALVELQNVFDLDNSDRVTRNFDKLQAVEVDVTRKTDLMAMSVDHLTDDAMIAAIVRAEELTKTYGGQNVALSELEITSNLYIGTAEDVTEATGELVDITIEAAAALRDQAQAAYELTPAYDEFQDKLIQANAHLSDEEAFVLRSNQALRDAQTELGNLGGALDTAGTDLGDYYTDTDRARGISMQFRDEINRIKEDLFGVEPAADSAASAWGIAAGEMWVEANRVQDEVNKINAELDLIDEFYATEITVTNYQDTFDAIAALKGLAEDAAGNYDITYTVTTTGDPPPGVGPLPAPDEDIPPPQFQHGGFTGLGVGLAGAVHRNEFVFDPVATRNIGVANLERMQRAAQSGAAVGGGGDTFHFNPQTTVIVQGGGSPAPDLIGQIRQVVAAENAKLGREAEARWRVRR